MVLTPKGSVTGGLRCVFQVFPNTLGWLRTTVSSPFGLEPEPHETLPCVDFQASSIRLKWWLFSAPSWPPSPPPGFTFPTFPPWALWPDELTLWDSGFLFFLFFSCIQPPRITRDESTGGERRVEIMLLLSLSAAGLGCDIGSILPLQDSAPARGPGPLPSALKVPLPRVPHLCFRAGLGVLMTLTTVPPPCMSQDHSSWVPESSPTSVHSLWNFLP